MAKTISFLFFKKWSNYFKDFILNLKVFIMETTGAANVSIILELHDKLLSICKVVVAGGFLHQSVEEC